eukprot:gene16454-biopygen11304
MPTFHSGQGGGVGGGAAGAAPAAPQAPPKEVWRRRRRRCWEKTQDKCKARQKIQRTCELHCDSDSFWPKDIRQTKYVVPGIPRLYTKASVFQKACCAGTVHRRRWQETRRRRREMQNCASQAPGKVQISAPQAPGITKSEPQAPGKGGAGVRSLPKL